MLFEEPAFMGFVNQEITDTKKSCEVLLSFDAGSKEEVDEIAKKAKEAGGKDIAGLGGKVYQMRLNQGIQESEK